jgi:hypothetical protein
VQAGAVLAVFGADDSRMQAIDPELVELARERSIQIALEGVRAWAAADRS